MDLLARLLSLTCALYGEADLLPCRMLTRPVFFSAENRSALLARAARAARAASADVHLNLACAADWSVEHSARAANSLHFL